MYSLSWMPAITHFLLKSSIEISLLFSNQEISSVLGISTRKIRSKVTDKTIGIGFLPLSSNAIVAYYFWTKIFIWNFLIKKKSIVVHSAICFCIYKSTISIINTLFLPVSLTFPCTPAYLYNFKWGYILLLNHGIELMSLVKILS